MNDADLIKALIQAAYDSGYYSGRRKDGQSHHLEAIEERGRLKDAALQRFGDLRATLEAILGQPGLYVHMDRRIREQARAALEAGDE
jgi:hypothetical protein